MTKLTPAGVALLDAAAVSQQSIQTPAGVHPTTVAALIKRGLLISIPVEGAPSRLLITDAGREAAQSPQSVPTEDGRAAPTFDECAGESCETEPGPEAMPPTVEPRGETPLGVKSPSGKLGVLVSLLCRPQGATVEQMTVATGWQAHSVRGAMSGGIKKELGLAVRSERTSTGRTYRIAVGAGE